MIKRANFFRNFGMGALVLLIGLGKASAASFSSNFLFGSGTPFGGTTTLGGVDVTLTTTNTEVFGTSSFRDQVNTDPSTITFNFSSPISEFSLSVSRVLGNKEFISGFNIGGPTQLTGDLINVGGVVTSTATDDFGVGKLIWKGASITTLSFLVTNDLSINRAAIAFDEFEIEPASTSNVPLPAAFWLFASGIAGLAGLRKKTV